MAGNLRNCLKKIDADWDIIYIICITAPVTKP